MNTLLDIQRATLLARERTGDLCIGTNAKGGLIQVCRVTFPPELKGRSSVNALTDYLSPRDALDAIERL